MRAAYDTGSPGSGRREMQIRVQDSFGRGDTDAHEKTNAIKGAAENHEERIHVYIEWREWGGHVGSVV